MKTRSFERSLFDSKFLPMKTLIAKAEYLKQLKLDLHNNDSIDIFNILLWYLNNISPIPYIQALRRECEMEAKRIMLNILLAHNGLK